MKRLPILVLALTVWVAPAQADPTKPGTSTTTTIPATPAPKTEAKAPPMSRKECIDHIGKAVRRQQALGRKISAPVMVAQAIIETGWCKSVPANNYWGVKAMPGEAKQVFITHEVFDGTRVKMADTFAAFASIDDAASAYADLIERAKHFADAEAVAYDSRAYILALQDGSRRFATDPAYVKSVLRVIDDNDLVRRYPPASVVIDDGN